MTYKEIVYIILDELKSASDDSFYTEDHVIFLTEKYRALLLKQKYADIKKIIPESNYQTICLDLIEIPAINGEPCEGGTYLRSKEKIPYIMEIGNPTVYPLDYYQGNITYVSRNRMKYVGHNRWLQNIIYASLGPDNYLYFKSSNPQFTQLEKVNMTGIFENPQEAFDLQCSDSDITCDILDMEFPLEESLVAPTIEYVLKSLLGASYRPKDDNNNANDDLSDLVSYIRRNAKSDLQKQIEGNA